MYFFLCPQHTHPPRSALRRRAAKRGLTSGGAGVWESAHGATFYTLPPCFYFRIRRLPCMKEIQVPNTTVCPCPFLFSMALQSPRARAAMPHCKGISLTGKAPQLSYPENKLCTRGKRVITRRQDRGSGAQTRRDSRARRLQPCTDLATGPSYWRLSARFAGVTKPRPRHSPAHSHATTLWLCR